MMLLVSTWRRRASMVWCCASCSSFSTSNRTRRGCMCQIAFSNLMTFSTRLYVSNSWELADGMAEQHICPSSGSRDWSDLVIHMESSPSSIPICFACYCWHLGCAHEWQALHTGVDTDRASWLLWQRDSTSSKYEGILRTRWWDLITGLSMITFIQLSITFALILFIISFNSLISFKKVELKLTAHRYCLS